MSDITRADRDINSLSTLAQQACRMFLEECKKQGLNVLITETYRSQARQDWLYEQGRSRPGVIATWTHSSRHTAKRAWDVCKNVKGQEYNDNSFFEQCGEIAKELGITWGGDWQQRDMPHFEISPSWKPKVVIKEDIQLAEACSKIIKSGINLNFNSWKRMDLIKISNVDALLLKLGGVDKLIADGVISSNDIWINKTYNVNHVRSLLIKYASKL